MEQPKPLTKEELQQQLEIVNSALDHLRKGRTECNEIVSTLKGEAQRLQQELVRAVQEALDEFPPDLPEDQSNDNCSQSQSTNPGT